MAKEKTANEIVEEKPRDPMKEMVSVTLPRATGNEENYLFVALNGKGYTIMRGRPVRVPRPVADIIRESERMMDRQADYIDGLDEQQRRARAAVPGAV